MTTLEELQALIKNHDLTFNYSDDNRAYQAGAASLDRIRELSKKFDRSFVVQIWNSNVDAKLVESNRAQFYWAE